MAIPKLDATAFSMMGLIIPVVIITKEIGVVLSMWADITIAICAGSMIFANYTYWLDSESIGTKIAHPLHIFGSIIGICAGFVSYVIGIIQGIIPFLVSITGNALNLYYGYTILAFIPLGQICCIISGLLAIQICSSQLKLALKGMSEPVIEVESKPVTYKRNNLVVLAILFTLVGLFVPDLVTQNGMIGIVSLVVPLHALGLVLMGVSFLILERLVGKLESLKQMSVEGKPTLLYLITDTGAVGGFAVGIGTIGTNILPMILKVFGVIFINGTFAQQTLTLIPVGSILLFIGGILGLVGFNQVMFVIHDAISKKE